MPIKEFHFLKTFHQNKQKNQSTKYLQRNNSNLIQTSRKTEEEGTLANSSYEASITFISKPDRCYKKIKL